MRQFLTLVAILVVGGCGADQAKQDLERQNLLAEIAKRNEERSAELSKREQAVASKERDNQDTLDKVNRREAELSERERNVGQRAEKAAKLQANAEATVQSLKDRESRLQEMVTKINTARELARMRQPFLEELAMNAAVDLSAKGPDPPGIAAPEEPLNLRHPGYSPLPNQPEYRQWAAQREQWLARITVSNVCSNWWTVMLF
jgi:TolA-binding protein